MSFTKKIFFISIICIFYFVDYVSALRNEAIVSGIPVRSYRFNHHAIIAGIPLDSIPDGNPCILGSGALVSDRFVITTSNILLYESGQLQPFKFSVVLGTFTWVPTSTNTRNIKRIFFTRFDSTFTYSNLAAAELSEDAGISRDYRVSVARLPNQDDVIVTEGVVSGYGFYLIQSMQLQDSPVPIVVNGTISTVLRYRKVRTLFDSQCANGYSREITRTNICGMTEKDYGSENIVGICNGDFGAPLVKEIGLYSILIGVASVITLDCDNTATPALYMKISAFRKNIDRFLEGNVADGDFVLENN